jgi:hypothetical protein
MKSCQKALGNFNSIVMQVPLVLVRQVSLGTPGY